MFMRVLSETYSKNLELNWENRGDWKGIVRVWSLLGTMCRLADPGRRIAARARGWWTVRKSRASSGKAEGLAAGCTIDGAVGRLTLAATTRIIPASHRPSDGSGS